VYAPVAGVVLAVNDQLLLTPELINRDPYGAGWLLRLRTQQPSATPELLSPAQYSALIA
jgi:glycine cleavage system H protein